MAIPLGVPGQTIKIGDHDWREETYDDEEEGREGETYIKCCLCGRIKKSENDNDTRCPGLDAIFPSL